MIFVYLLAFFVSINATILVLSTNDTYMDRPALFGPTINHDAPLAGHVMNIVSLSENGDRYGCNPIQQPPPPSRSWIALVERGHCSFVAKVRAMQLSNAKAVIIGDPYLNHWLTMYALEDTSDIKIPSIYVAQYQFRALQLHSQVQPILVELINENDPSAWSWADMMMVILFSPCMMFLILYFGWKCRTYHRHLNNVASCHVVSHLPARYYQQQQQEEEDDICAICLQTYLDNEKIRTLPCRHEFHVHCIDPWLTTRKKVCPICKFNVCQSVALPTPQTTEHTPLLPL